MRAQRLTVAVVAAAVTGLAPVPVMATAAPAMPQSPLVASPGSLQLSGVAKQRRRAFEAEVLRLTNRARTRSQNCGREGVMPKAAPLKANTKLTVAARRHARDMAANSYFSHTSRNGQDAGDRISAAGFRWSWWGENIAAGYGSPRAVVTGWLESDGHCANLMSRHFTHLGVGYARDADSDYGSYWVQNFARPR